MRRNFNEPTSALFFLIPQSQARFTFTRKRETSVGGVDVWEIAFKETATPTLIRTTDGLDVPSEGTVWVTPSDGTVVQTRLVLGGFAGPSSSSNVEVTYARDPRLGIWLPATMKERHDGFLEKASSAGRGIRTVAEHSAVMGTATYSDFKRFEMSAIIK